MATRFLLCHIRRLAGIAVASCMLAASPLTASPLPQPAVPLQASTPTLPAAPEADDPGVIAYVQRSTNAIHVIRPDGSGDEVLWTPTGMVIDEPAADLAWRRDGGELAFSSGHEQDCSYYASDIYAIRSDGSHYRRITNAPACAELAALPKGSVTVDVTAAVSGAQVYVMGAQGLTGAPYPGGLVTVNNVADFGEGVQQPAVGIFGHYRTRAGPPYADVVPGQTVSGGFVRITNTGVSGFGAYKISWKADASALSYGTGTCNALGHLSSHPAYGRLGDVLPVVAGADPCQVAWGPTAAGDQYVYYSSIGLNQETGYGGIYLNSLGDASGGTQVVYFTYWDTAVFDMEWLPDGSGFLFTNLYVLLDPPGTYSTIYKYDFATKSLSAVLTTRAFCIRDLSISPNGQHVVFHTTADQYFDPTSSLWIVNIDGSGLHKLLDDAGLPAWGPAYTPDTTAPTVNCGTADGQWHTNDVSIACTAGDSGSGLANPADASFSLSTSVPAGTETANGATGTRSVCDRDGNCATAGPIGGNRVDKKTPSITINSPSAAFYLLNQPVAASYSCSDGGSSVATCVGPVSNGSNIDCGAAGHKTFTVNASDAAGNTCSQSVDYTVGYRVWLPAMWRP